MSDYDSPWKEALEVYFEPFLEFFFPDIHADIDWGRRYEFLDKELQRIVREGEVGRRVVDKLAKVGRASGQKPWILMHVEVQTFKEADFARRMYVYHTRLFHRYNSEVASLAVLGDDDPHWRPYRYVHRLWGVSTEFTFPVAKLLDYAPQAEALEQSGNPFAAFVLAHLKTLQTRDDPQQRLLWKVRLVKGLYERGLEAGEFLQRFRLIDWIMDLPETLAKTFWEEVQHFEQEKHMPFMTTPERIGREEGLAQGLVQGRQEGLEQGRKDGLIKGIAALLELKFHEEGLRLMPEIADLQGQERLEAVLQAIPGAASPEDLRRMWTE